jgi:hypothetical protein
MNRVIFLVAGTWLVALPASGQSAAERVIVQDFKVALPPTPCTVTATAGRIAQVVEEPFGTERWPADEPCPIPPVSAEGITGRLTLTGLTAREALDRLMEVDSRYEWREIDGVIVVRPRMAWSDPNHFLHRTVSSFTVHDQHLGSTLEAVIDTFGPFRWPGGGRFISSTRQADRVISLNLGTTSILEILNAAVRTHGAMGWVLSYCGSATYENAWFRFFTFDLAGPARPAFPNGVGVDESSHRACGPGFSR